MTKFRYTHSRVIDGKRHVWNVERLWAISADLPIKHIPVDSIVAIDEDCWFSGKAATIRDVVRHCRRIVNAPIELPIILDADGSLMDGGHRVARALLEGIQCLPAVQFSTPAVPDVIEPVE
jgi:hypothetical protein